jgi:chaperone required for assembly of F1-ATPase
MNLGVLGSLLVQIKAEGAKEARKQMEGMQTSTKKAGDEAKRSVPALEKMGKRWASVLGLVAASGTIAFGLIAKSSPSVMAALKGIQLAFEEIFMVIGEELSPVFETLENILWKIADWFNELSPTTKTFIAGLALGVIVVGALAAAFAGAVAVAPLVTGALAAIGLTLGTAIAIIGGVIIALALLYTAWQTNFLGIRDIAHSVISWLKERWTSLMDILQDENKTTWEKVKGVIGWVIGTIKDVLVAYWKFYLQVMGYFYDTTVEKFTSIKDFIIDSFKTAYEYVVGKLDSLTTYLNKVLSKISSVFSGSSSSSSGGTDKTQYDSDGRVSLNQSVSARALGGPVMNGLSYLVGENGPEMFTPKLSGSITPTKQTQQAISKTSQQPVELNQKIEVKLDGRTVWESVRKYSAAELRRLGA